MFAGNTCCIHKVEVFCFMFYSLSFLSTHAIVGPNGPSKPLLAACNILQIKTVGDKVDCLHPCLHTEATTLTPEGHPPPLRQIA